MKKIVFILLIAFGLNMSAQEKVNWLTFEKAVELTKTNPKPILIDVYTDWCGWCKKMDKDTYANAIIAKYINMHFYAVKFDGEGKKPITFNNFTYKFRQEKNTKYHELGAALLNGKLAYPTTIFMNSDMKLLDRIQGYIDTKKMEKVLAFFGDGIYKKEKWNNFEKKFKSKL